MRARACAWGDCLTDYVIHELGPGREIETSSCAAKTLLTRLERTRQRSAVSELGC